MPGGFHPFHAGHAALYQSARRAFPDAEVFVAATNDMSARPFPFAVKEKLARLAGVEPGHFMQVKSPFKAEEITKNFNPDEDVVIFIRSEKDAGKPPMPGGTKKDGTPGYLQSLIGAKKLEPFIQHAYMAYLPTVEFGPGMTSATEIRAAWPTLNEKRKTALVMSLYPKTQTNPKLAANVVKMLDTAIGTQEVDEGWKTGATLGGIAGGIAGGPAGAVVGAGAGAIAGHLMKGKDPKTIPGYSENLTDATSYVLDHLPKTSYGELVMSARPQEMGIGNHKFDAIILNDLIPEFFIKKYGEEKGSYYLDKNPKLAKALYSEIQGLIRGIIPITITSKKFRDHKHNEVSAELGDDPKYLKYFGISQYDDWEDKQGVAESTADDVTKLFTNVYDPAYANLQRVALLAMQGRQSEAAGLLQRVIKDADPAVQKKIVDAVNNIKPVTINGRVADSSTLDKSKQHQDWITNTFIPWVQSLLGQQGVTENADYLDESR
jgi:hypothetical protein